MALPSTLHRFRINLADVDRDRYETLALRLPRHPSESLPYLLTRVIAYALNVQEGIAFSDGLCVPDEPAIKVTDLTGAVLGIIEIGNPSGERLHRAMKTAAWVRVYTYRDPEILLTALAKEVIHRRQQLEIFAIPPPLLEALSTTVQRDNTWEILHSHGELTITVGDVAHSAEVTAAHL